MGRLGLEALNLTRDARSSSQYDATKEDEEPPRVRPLLSGLIVQTTFRRRGVAQKLVAHAELRARSWGYDEMCIQVEDANKPAIELYRSMGYRLHDGSDLPAPSPSTESAGLLQGMFAAVVERARSSTLSLRKEL